MNQLRDTGAKAMEHASPTTEPRRAGLRAVDLRALLDAGARGELDTIALTDALLQHCREDSDATWEALSLLDQYYRRGLLDKDAFANVKAAIHALVFNVPAPSPKFAKPPRRKSEFGDTGEPSKRSEPGTSSTDMSIDAAVAASKPGTGADSTTPPTAISTFANEVRTDDAPCAETNSQPDHEPTGDSFAGLMGLMLLAAIAFAAIWSLPPTRRHAPDSTVNEPRSTPTAATAATVVATTKQAVIASANATGHTDSHPDTTRQVAEISPTPAAVPEHSNVAALAFSTSPRTAPIPAAKPSISFTTDQAIVDYGAAVAKLAVHRAGSTRDGLLVHWHTVEGSAKEERDFVATSDGTVEFKRGEHTATIFVPIVQRTDRRYSEWFEVALTSDDEMELTPIASATVVIVSAEAAQDEATQN